MNDDAISFLPEIQKIYKSYNLICDNLIPLKFPIIKKMKWMLWEELPKVYHDYIVTCESPRLGTTIMGDGMEIINYDPCGHCLPCEKILATNNHHTGPFGQYKGAHLEKALNTVRHHQDVERKEVEGRYYYLVELDEPELKVPARQLHIPFEEGEKVVLEGHKI